MALRSIELFAGAGGLLRGVEHAGFQTVLAAEMDKWACATLRHNSKAGLTTAALDVREGRLEEIDWAAERLRLGDIDIVGGGPPCFPAGTLVLTKRGLIPIEQVVVGDEALTHLGNYRRVLATGGKKAPTIRLDGQGRTGLVTTAEHPFWAVSRVRGTWDNERRTYPYSFSKPSWVEAQDMTHKFWATHTAYPELPVPTVIPRGAESARPELGPAFFWVVGAWLGDGWSTIKQRSGRAEGQTEGRTCFGLGESKIKGFVEYLAAAGLSGAVSPQRTTTRFSINGYGLAQWFLANFGDKSEGKYLPAWALGMPREWRESLLAGYLFTDGSRRKNPEGWQANSVSKRLAVGMRLLATTLGYGTSLRLQKTAPTTVIEGRTVNQRDYWTLGINDRSRSSAEHAGLRLGLVRKVEPTGESEQVYNLAVEGDNSYTADGIIVHNCQSWSTAGKGLGEADPRNGWPWALDVVAKVKPRSFIFENVKGMTTQKNLPYLERIVREFAALGYTVQWRLFDAADFAVPQRRHRIFVVGLREPKAAEAFRWPEPTHSIEALVTAKWLDFSYWREHSLVGPDGFAVGAKPDSDGKGRSVVSGDEPSPALRLRLGREDEGLILPAGAAFDQKCERGEGDGRTNFRSGDEPAFTMRVQHGGGGSGVSLRLPSGGAIDPKHAPNDLDAAAAAVRSGGSGHDSPPVYAHTTAKPSKEELRVLRKLESGDPESLRRAKLYRWRTVRDALTGLPCPSWRENPYTAGNLVASVPVAVRTEALGAVSRSVDESSPTLSGKANTYTAAAAAGIPRASGDRVHGSQGQQISTRSRTHPAGGTSGPALQDGASAHEWIGQTGSEAGRVHVRPATTLRRLTVREVSRLQSFPDSWFFCGPKTSNYKQIGNAAPELLVEPVARAIREALEAADLDAITDAPRRRITVPARCCDLTFPHRHREKQSS